MVLIIFLYFCRAQGQDYSDTHLLDDENDDDENERLLGDAEGNTAGQDRDEDDALQLDVRKSSRKSRLKSQRVTRVSHWSSGAPTAA